MLAFMIIMNSNFKHYDSSNELIKSLKDSQMGDSSINILDEEQERHFEESSILGGGGTSRICYDQGNFL